MAMTFDAPLKPLDSYYLKVLFILLGMRFIAVLSTWYLARSSFVFLITYNVGVSTNLLGDVLLFILRIIIALALEITITTSINRNTKEGLLVPTSWSRLVRANVILLFAELMLMATLMLELHDLRSRSFVLSVISTASFLWILLNPSGYAIQWLIVGLYIFGMIILLLPKSDDSNLKSIDIAAFVLMLRSVFLPI